MNGAKIHLSPAEMELVQNAGWILTKNRVLEKVRDLLSEQSVLQQDYLQAGTNAAFPPTQPKISRGENYKGLPYLMLDYPRSFSHNDTFAIRTFFWWGHFFSITLQLAGSYKQTWKDNILLSYDLLAKKNYYLCIHGDPWEHHFEETNYQSISQISREEFSKIIEEMGFVKLAARIELTAWDLAGEFLITRFRELVDLLRN